MNQLASLGLILLLALIAGHLVKFIRVPEVTGYILAGVAMGPSVLGWISHDNLDTLKVFSQVALGLILFSIGSAFEFSRFEAIGRQSFLITGVESLLTAGLVAGGMFAIGQPWPVALLLGAIAIETAAASTLMVIRECNARGPLTETLTAIIAMNNILCLFAYSLVAAVLDVVGAGGRAGIAGTIGAALFPLIWQMLGGAALGFLIGLLLTYWASQVVEHGETLILLAGTVLLCVGAAQFLEVSPLVASLSVGATMVNLSGKSRRLFNTLSRTDPPLYAIFFVIAGADLNLGLIPSLGIMGGIYVGGRLIGKYAGSTLAALRLHGARALKRHLGFAMLSQAGLAIGLVLITSQRFPKLAPTINTVVLSAVAIFELIGPVSARFALVRSGEANKEEDLPLDVLD